MDNNVNYTNTQVMLNWKEPPAPRHDIADFQNIKSVLRKVQQ